MFDQLRQLKQFADLQNKLSKEKIEIEKEGVRLTMNGKMEIEEIILNPDLEKERQERIIKDCFNDAFKKVQMLAAQKMFQS